jgi:hypothetical protein
LFAQSRFSKLAASEKYLEYNYAIRKVERKFPAWIRRTTIVLTLLLFSSARTPAQDVSQHVQEAVKTIRELRTIPLPNFDLGPVGPPARVPGLLRQLNQALRDLIIAVLNDPHRDSLADVDMVYNELKSAGWGDIYRSRWNAYGEISNIDFQWVTDHDPPLLVVTDFRRAKPDFQSKFSTGCFEECREARFK